MLFLSDIRCSVFLSGSSNQQALSLSEPAGLLCAGEKSKNCEKYKNESATSKERKKEKKEMGGGFERQLLQSTVKLIARWTVKRVEMRKEDESGSERSGLRDGARESEENRGSGEQERQIIRVGQVEPVKLIIEVN